MVLTVFIPQLERNTVLDIEQRNASKCESVSLQSILSSSFQKSFESFVSDAVPLKDNVVLANAYLQRTSIRLANSIFSYTAYPTYYGSNKIHSDADGRICFIPSTKSKTLEKKLKTAADGLNNLSEAISGKLVYCLPLGISSSKFNPAYTYVTNAVDENYMQECFLNKLNNKWLVNADTYSSLEDYSKNYFMSDHHWNINAAVKNYKQIMQLLEKEPVAFSESYKVDYLPKFYGTHARTGADLDGANDCLLDVDYKHSKLKVTVNGQEQTEGFLNDKYELDSSKKWHASKSYSDAYFGYFHPTKKEIVIENSSCNNNETLLLIADSYASCMESFFAESYSKVVVIDPRKTKESLKDIANKYSAKDCLCIINRVTLVNAKSLETFQR